MGTVFSFDIYAPELAVPDRLLALVKARRTLHQMDAIFSTYRDDSPMSRLRRGEIADDEVPLEIPRVLALCEIVRDLTDGWFDPWAVPGGVDPTGLVKGWSAERSMEDLLHCGVISASINAGGDIATVGSPHLDGGPWRFGIKDPFSKDLAAIASVEHAIATSGTYERPPHLFDPKRNGRAEGSASATVVGDELWLADGLATALAVAGPALLDHIDRAGYAGFVITRERKFYASPQFPFVELEGNKS